MVIKLIEKFVPIEKIISDIDTFLYEWMIENEDIDKEMNYFSFTLFY